MPHIFMGIMVDVFSMEGKSIALDGATELLVKRIEISFRWLEDSCI